MHLKPALLSLWCVAAPVMAGQSGGSASHNAASNLDEYCFYTIYTTLSEYTFEGAVTVSSDTSAGSTSHGSSSSSSTSNETMSHGSDSNATSSTISTPSSVSSDQGSSSSSMSTASSHGKSRRSLQIAKRGHHGSGGTSTGPCNATLEVSSMYASAMAWCSAKQLKAAVPYWQSLCEQSSLKLMDLTDIEANMTADYIASLPLVDPEQNSTTTTATIDSVVLLSHAYYERAYKSYVSAASRISDFSSCDLTHPINTGNPRLCYHKGQGLRMGNYGLLGRCDRSRDALKGLDCSAERLPSEEPFGNPVPCLPNPRYHTSHLHAGLFEAPDTLVFTRHS